MAASRYLLFFYGNNASTLISLAAARLVVISSISSFRAFKGQSLQSSCPASITTKKDWLLNPQPD